MTLYLTFSAINIPTPPAARGVEQIQIYTQGNLDENQADHFQRFWYRLSL